MSDLSLTRPVDLRTLHFGPLGLGGPMRPEVSQRILANTVEPLVLPVDVPSHVRDQFDRLRQVFRDGLFTYDRFTNVDRESFRVLEVALKVRLLHHYNGVLPITMDGHPTRRDVASFHDVRALFTSRGRKARLADHPKFNGSLAALCDWARRERYFYGQRNRLRELVTPQLRNHIQHTEGDVVLMPPDARTALRHTFEMICRLWGRDGLPGGTYPGAITRSPWVVGLGPGDFNATAFPLDHPATLASSDRESRVWYAVLAVEGEELCWWRPSGFDVLATPVRQLWGPGTWLDLRTALDRAAPPWTGDTVELLDRLFYVRVMDGQVDPPRSQEQVKALRGRSPAERWLVVRADNPAEALGHVRAALDGSHRLQGPCQCPVEGVLPLARRDTVDRFIRDVVSQLPRPRRAPVQGRR